MATPIYDHYYTASDVNVFLHFPPTGKTVNIDKAVAIAYTHNISSVPIYTLGSLEPLYFTRGNSIVQGQLDLAFKSTLYLKTAINYLVTNTKETTPKTTKKPANKMTTEELRESQREVATGSDLQMESKSLIQQPSLFDIRIVYNNSNSNMAGNQETIILQGIKFTGQSQATNSHDDTALVDRYTFLAKNIA
ncbi:hypothetical protein FDH01_gp032 [Acinetobacter phage vB_AbaM_ME3]|uniref:Uncharacterized protein n=1 Tax=Acinetobacter phage vB_AbaM_ME3 TaxID=1837876 RepID=A0A172Q081_9CAUD|nr:hypothetical protein FDH01_gp032 [Acinetobacter phage vB_AbaM_ME3]AND75193.1 hypothetical protein ME3_32 [Acinetobacter phage vB_AbaM_ME3]